MSTTTVGSGAAVWAYPVFLGGGLAVALCALVTAAQLSAPPELMYDLQLPKLLKVVVPY